MIQSLLASTWKFVSSSQALGVLKPSAPLAACQFQLASSVQVWRKLEVLLRQRIWLLPAIVSAASICHSLNSLPAGAFQGEEISLRMPGPGPGPNSTKALPSPRLRSLVLPKSSMVVEGAALRIVPTTQAVVPML